MIVVTYNTNTGVEVTSIRVSVTLAFYTRSSVLTLNSVVTFSTFLARESLVSWWTLTLFHAAGYFSIWYERVGGDVK